jgi:hypothetical protein
MEWEEAGGSCQARIALLTRPWCLGQQKSLRNMAAKLQGRGHQTMACHLY